MKSEDITVIASTIIALTLVIGTVVYFQKDGEKKRLRKLILLNGFLHQVRIE